MRLLVLLAAWVWMGCGTVLAGTCSDGTVCDADSNVYDGPAWIEELNDELVSALAADQSAVICLDGGPFQEAFSLDHPGADITLCTADTSAPVELGAIGIGREDTVGEQGLRSLRLRDVRLGGHPYGLLVAADVDRVELENVVMTPETTDMGFSWKRVGHGNPGVECQGRGARHRPALDQARHLHRPG